MQSKQKGTTTSKASRVRPNSKGSGSLRATLVSSITKRSTIPVTSGYCEKLVSRFPVKVYDEAGVDVTPLPLMYMDPSQCRQSVGDTGSVNSPTDLLSQLSTAGTTSIFGGGPFSRSVFTPSSLDTGESVADDEAQGSGSAWADIRQKRLEVKEVLTAWDLYQVIVITLEETELLWLMDIPTVCVAAETKEAENVAMDNALYAKLCKSRAGNDLYAEREMNTFNEAPKVKSVQTNTTTTNSKGMVCTNFDMHDTYADLEAPEKVSSSESAREEDVLTDRREVAPPDVTQSIRRQISQGSKRSQLQESCMESRNTTSSQASSVLFPSFTTPEAGVPSEVSSLNEEKIMKSELLKKDLFVMERVINLNNYQPKQAVYRGFPIILDMDIEKPAKPSVPIAVNNLGPNLDRLWSYGCHRTKGRNVACMAWSKANPDLIAVGYGQYEFTAQKSGLICCWCLKNPEYPERIYTSKSGVTSLDFSEGHPNILAAGYYDGGVALYNVRNPANEVLLDSQRDGSTSTSAADDNGVGETDSHTKHLGPVWQMQWIEKERGAGEERTEVLISVSTDGHVMQWSIRNGFECYDIMRLKKTTTRMSGKAKSNDKKDEAIISRYAGGLCFDFDAFDHNQYLVGTEEGYIHKCSCSYNEQYLETYSGHTGPVYRVRFSPFVPNIFLSCSADWSLCLWHVDRTGPILKFHSTTKQVPDLCWSPRCSTVFACVNEGSVEVWDLAQSTLDAVISLCPTYNVKLSTISFAKNTDCILVGDSEGQVAVYELRCMPPYPPFEEQAYTLSCVINASLASQLVPLDTTKLMVEQPGRRKSSKVQDSSSDHACKIPEGLRMSQLDF